MLEYSTTSVVSYSDNSSDESDSNHHSPPHRHNTCMHQYTNSPQYDRNTSIASACGCSHSHSRESDHVYHHPHSAGSVHVADNNIEDAEPAVEVCIPTFIAAVCPASSAAPFTVPHLVWSCKIDDHSSSFLPQHPIHALLDHGSPVILIREMLVTTLNLRRRRLHEPFVMDTTMPSATSTLSLTE